MRIKYRYLLVEAVFADGRDARGVNEREILEAARRELEAIFGRAAIAASAPSLQLKFSAPSAGVYMLRVFRSVLFYFWGEAVYFCFCALLEYVCFGFCL
jgi:hypothetical protein